MRFLALTACGFVLSGLGCPRSGAHESPSMAIPDPVVVQPPRDAGALDATRADADVASEARCDPSHWTRPLRGLPCLSDAFPRRPVGFSREGRTLVSCTSSCDPCPLACVFDDGKRETVLSYFESAGMAGNLSDAQVDKLRAAHDKKLDDLLVRLGVAVPNDPPELPGDRAPLRGPFAYDDLTFALEALPEDADGAVGVAFGARVDGEAPVLTQRIVLAPHPMRGRMPKEARTPEERAAWNEQWTMTPPDLFVDVSHDGTELGLVAMSSGTMWYEASKTVRLQTSVFAARIYAETARSVRGRGAHEKAAALFGKAAAAQPGEWTFAYERAVALASTHDPRAEGALNDAVRVGGARAIARAKSESTLAAEPWFAKWSGKP